jgi:imidazolonepropionase-like amidohydrolase
MRKMISALFSILILPSVLFATGPAKLEAPGAIAFTGFTLIDGRGGEALPGGALVVESGRIKAIGPAASVEVPKGCRVVDLGGAFVLPGFINAHVHRAFNAERLKAWAAAGVTSVRDMGSQGLPIDDAMRWRKESREVPEYARLFAVGPMITVPGGYGSLEVSSPAEARKTAAELIEAGVDAIKASLEDGYAGTHGLNKLSDEELAALIGTARERGSRTSIHITEARYLRQAVLAGPEEIAHIAYDYVDLHTWDMAAAKGIILIPTFTVFRNYGAPSRCACSTSRTSSLPGGGSHWATTSGEGRGISRAGFPCTSSPR